MSDEQNDTQKYDTTEDDTDEHVDTEDDKHKHVDTEDESSECMKAVNDICPILLWYMYNYIAGYLLLLIIFNIQK